MDTGLAVLLTLLVVAAAVTAVLAWRCPGRVEPHGLHGAWARYGCVDRGGPDTGPILAASERLTGATERARARWRAARKEEEPHTPCWGDDAGWKGPTATGGFAVVPPADADDETDAPGEPVPTPRPGDHDRAEQPAERRPR